MKGGPGLDPAVPASASGDRTDDRAAARNVLGETLDLCPVKPTRSSLPEDFIAMAAAIPDFKARPTPF